jgi:hypothetical protein
MKTIFTILLSSMFCVTAWACQPSDVLHVTLPLIILPGQRPVFEDGSTAHPFRSIKKAIDKGRSGQYCNITLKLTKGTFTFDAGVNTSNLTIIGTERDSTIIRGGIFSVGSVILNLENLTLSGEAPHMLQMNDGELILKKIRVIGYRFIPDLVNKKPFAIGLNNVKGQHNRA